jgi:hypothetical protein
MGGGITVQSSLGRGSVFRFSLPLTEGVPAREGRRDTSCAPSRLRPGQEERRILVGGRQRGQSGDPGPPAGGGRFVVREAGDGRLACSLYGQWKPHLVLLDMIMPEMDGFAVL